MKIAILTCLFIAFVHPNEPNRRVVSILPSQVAKTSPVLTKGGLDSPNQAAFSRLGEAKASNGVLSLGATAVFRGRRQQELEESVRRIDAGGFTFEVRRCKLSGSTVTCDLLITNNEKDRDLVLPANYTPGNSRFIDESGNEYRASKHRLGSSEGGYVQERLVKDVPTKAAIVFDNVSSDSTTMRVLETVCWASDIGQFTVQIRNVPIVR